MKKIIFLGLLLFIASSVWSQSLFKFESGSKSIYQHNDKNTDLPAWLNYQTMPNGLKMPVVKETVRERGRNHFYRPLIVKPNREDASTVYVEKVKSANPDKATITLRAKDINYYIDGGFVMLISKDPLKFADEIQNGFTAEYKIPEGAIADPKKTPVVRNASMSIEISEGDYDYMILYNIPGDQAWGVPYPWQDEPAMGHQVPFEKGWTYNFVMQRSSMYGSVSTLDIIPAHKIPDHYELPFFDDFKEPYYLQWDMINANADGTTWEWLEEIDIYGNGGMWYQFNDLTPANDYMITNAPLALPAGESNFSFTYGSGEMTECFEIYYGKTNKPEEMNRLDRVEVNGVTVWKYFSKPIHLSEAGKYYFAIRVCSQVDQHFFTFRDVRIESGAYNPKPDLSILSAVMPMGSCLASAAEKITFTIHNFGDLAADSYTVTYNVDGVTGSETFNTRIAPYSEETLTLSRTFDLSAPDKTYPIALSVNVANDRHPENDAFSTSYTSLSPKEIPYTNWLLNQEEVDWFQPGVAGGWLYESQYSGYYGFGDYLPMGTDIPLYTGCIHLKPGGYTLTFAYDAGAYGYLTDDFEVWFGKSGTDISTWKMLKRFENQINQNIEESFLEASVSLPVVVEDNYRVAFISKLFANLAIGKVEIDQMSGRDLILDYSRETNRAIPMKQLTDNAYNIEFSLFNASASQENVELNVWKNETIASTQNIVMTAGEVKNMVLPQPINEPQEVTFAVTAKMTNDTDETNNSIEPFTIEFCNTFATESLTQSKPNSIGFYSANWLGNVYVLKNKDDLTSISCFFASGKEGLDMQLDVYEIIHGTPATYYLGSSPLVSLRVKRPFQNWQTYNLSQPLTLEPGTYFFAIRQLTAESIDIVCDLSPTGQFYQPRGTSNIIDCFNEDNPFGNIALRANFGSPNVDIKSVQTGNSRVYTAGETLYINADCLVDQVAVYDVKGVNLIHAGNINNANYTISIAGWKPGVYVVRVSTDNDVKAYKFIKH